MPQTSMKIRKVFDSCYRRLLSYEHFLSTAQRPSSCFYDAFVSFSVSTDVVLTFNTCLASPRNVYCAPVFIFYFIRFAPFL